MEDSRVAHVQHACELIAGGMEIRLMKESRVVIQCESSADTEVAIGTKYYGNGFRGQGPGSVGRQSRTRDHWLIT